MKKTVKIIGILVSVVVLAAGVALAYVSFGLPNVGAAPDLEIERTPVRVARGEYIANHVAVCMDCHSTRDFTRFGGPVVPGTQGRGGEPFDQTAGFPGSFTSKNITPYGLGTWTDGEIYRAITTGVGRDGHAFFPVMPYTYYRHMNEEDAKSVVAYLRTLKPIENTPPASKADFPFNFIINTIPQKADPFPLPDPSDEVATGHYLITMAGCAECHTPAENGQIIADKKFSGGREFAMSSGTLHTPNLTPDKETGIGHWTKEAFVARFKMYADSSYVPPKLAPDEMQTLMPWTLFAGMTEKDLGAIYAYLMSIKPIKNSVPERFTPTPKTVALAQP